MAIPLTGQVALSATPTAMDATARSGSCVAFSIKAPASNAQPAFIGGPSVSSTTGYQLDPGDELSYERISQNGQPTYVLSPADFYAVGTTGDKVTWLASP